ncbi:transposase [Stenotrophomonas maltophilia]|uniref:transposase n=1 Tax=Stenotrophomonas maltophilia TaxID=40324 RepID=UPI001AAEC6A5
MATDSPGAVFIRQHHDFKKEIRFCESFLHVCRLNPYRRITRWEHEHVLERMQMLLDARPEAAVARRQTVEHVFGTLKSWLGTTPLLTKTLPKVKTEISLAVLAYNMKRMIKIVGTQGMVRAIAA